jgi:RHS repeat-associated protein
MRHALTQESSHSRKGVAASCVIILLLGLAHAIAMPSAATAESAWSGSVTLATSAASVDANDPVATLTATLDASLTAPYYLSVYDDLGRRVAYCYPGDCVGGVTLKADVAPDNNQTRLYTAYVARDLPSSGPPIDDVRATSLSAVTVENVGWTGSVGLVNSRAVVDANEPTAVLTATLSKKLAGPYWLSIYDDRGVRVSQCHSSFPCADGGTSLTVSVTPDNNATRVYTAYVAQDVPGSGKPVTDVRSTSVTSVENIGWTGSVGLVTSRAVVDANEPTAVLTATLSKKLAGPYWLSIYDDRGVRVSQCHSSFPCADGGTSLTVSVTPDNNATRVYTAYVAQDVPGSGKPVTDVRSTSVTSVENIGWTGSSALSRSWVNLNDSSMVLTATLSKKLAGPYWLSIYDDRGVRVSQCHSSHPCADGGTSLTVTVTVTDERNYWAYVSQDVPSPGPPVVDIRAISGVYSSSGQGPTSPGETAGGSNPSEECSQRCHADPINTATGEYWDSATDMGVPGSGPGLAFTRSYAASRAGHRGPLGYGWTHNYDLQLSIAPGATGSTLGSATLVAVRQENGSQVVFTRTTSGLYSAPARVLARLTLNNDGSFTFVRRHRQKFDFAPSGHLTSIADLNGNAVSLTRDAEGRLARVTDADGRYLQLSWTGDRIAGVADHSQREVTYGYDAAGDLTAVTGVTGEQSSFTYTSTHLVATMTSSAGGVTSNTYDAQNRVIRQVDPLGRTTTFAYESGTTTITDPSGAVTIERYLDGQLASETKAAGTAEEATTSYSYGPTNHVTQITGPLGEITQYTYDDGGNRTTAVDPLGRVTRWSYDHLGNITKVVDPAGNESSLTYDSRGNLLSTTDALGATTRYVLNPDGSRASATDPRGNTSQYEYDAYGNPTVAVTPEGHRSAAAFDTLGRLASRADARGGTTRYTYDDAGRTLSVTDPLGAVETTKYDFAGRPVAVTDAVGGVTTFVYDVMGQMLQITDASGATTSYTYDAAGRRVTSTDPAGNVTRISYDTLGRVAAVADPLGRATRRGWSRSGQPVAITLPSGESIHNTYDAAGQLVTSTDPLGGVTRYRYDDLGRVVEVMDAEGRKATTAHDAAGRPTLVTRNDGSAQRYTYDAAGLLLTYADAAGGTTRYTYDRDGRRVSSADALDRITRFSYDAAGDVNAVTAPDGSVVTYTRDAAGRPERVDYSEAATPDVQFSYDAAGRRIGMVDGTGTHTYRYDAAGRLIRQVDGAGQAVSYGWDPRGLLTRLTYPTGQHVDRAHDAAGQLTAVTDWVGRRTDFAYGANGALRETSYANGAHTQWARDQADRPTSITTTRGTSTILALNYAHSATGLITSKAEGPAAQTDYGYDALARLTSLTNAGASSGSYAFDAAGNLSGTPAGQVHSYDPSGQLLRTTGPAGQATDYAWSSRGNRVSATVRVDGSATTTEYAYDQANRLTGIASPDGIGTAHTYNGDGLRTSSTTSTATVTIKNNFTWDHSGQLPLLLSDGDSTYLYGPGSAPFAQIDAETGETSYLHGDQIGSTRAVTDAAGAVTETYDYDPYGNPSSSTGDGTTRFRFAGEYSDRDSGLIYLRARYYEPSTGQFLTRDPLEDSTRTPYGYAGSNPLLYTDPTGLDWLDDAASWSAAFGDTLTLGGTQQLRRLIDYGLNGTTEDLVDNCSTFYKWGGVGGGIASVVPVSGGLAWAGRAVKSVKARMAGRAVAEAGGAYGTALSGGRHAGFLANYAGKPTAQIERGITSIEKQIAEHQAKIANPGRYIDDWESLDPRQQQALVNRKWPGDIARQQEQLDILRGILGSR